jgi:hypothetical protein
VTDKNRFILVIFFLTNLSSRKFLHTWVYILELGLFEEKKPKVENLVTPSL